MNTETQSSISPELGSTPFQEAAEAWKRRDYQKAIEILTRASQQQPANSKLLLDLAEAYGRRFEYQEAERCLDSAASVATDKAEILAEAGRRCLRFDQPRMGNRYFTRAAEHQNVHPQVLVELAEFEESRSRVEAALVFLERAVSLQPNHTCACGPRSSASPFRRP